MISISIYKKSRKIKKRNREKKHEKVRNIKIKKKGKKK